MSVNLEDYTTVNGLAKIVKVTPPRMHRIIQFLGLPSHRMGHQLLVRKSYADRVKKLVDEQGMRPGPKAKKEKKKALALRAGPKHRLVTTQ